MKLKALYPHSQERFNCFSFHWLRLDDTNIIDMFPEMIGRKVFNWGFLDFT